MGLIHRDIAGQPDGKALRRHPDSLKVSTSVSSRTSAPSSLRRPPGGNEATPRSQDGPAGTAHMAPEGMTDPGKVGEPTLRWEPGYFADWQLAVPGRTAIEASRGQSGPPRLLAQAPSRAVLEAAILAAWRFVKEDRPLGRGADAQLEARDVVGPDPAGCQGMVEGGGPPPGRSSRRAPREASSRRSRSRDARRILISGPS
jgi:hypothetical protein